MDVFELKRKFFRGECSYEEVEELQQHFPNNSWMIIHLCQRRSTKAHTLMRMYQTYNRQDESGQDVYRAILKHPNCPPEIKLLKELTQ